MLLLTLLNNFVDDLLSPIYNYYEKILKKARKIMFMLLQIMFWAFVFCFCVWIAILFYAFIYQLAMPNVFQAKSIVFVKKRDGYETRIFQTDGQYYICRHASLLNLTENYDQDPISRTCLNPMQTNNFNFEFSSEVYEVHLKLLIPLLKSNFEIGAFPVRTEFINKNLQVFYADTIGYFDQVQYRSYSVKTIYKMFKAGLGMDENHAIIDVPLTENFDNTEFDLNVLNIYLMDKNLVIKEGYLEVMVKLSGWRYYMYHWFWLTGSYVVLSMAVQFFFTILGARFILRRYARNLERRLIIFRQEH